MTEPILSLQNVTRIFEKSPSVGERVAALLDERYR